MKRFDINTIQPFEPVLVRDNPTELWLPNFFYWFCPDEPASVRCLNLSWENCIPYNDETKHLIGTSDDCPDYYKWWEE